MIPVTVSAPRRVLSNPRHVDLKIFLNVSERAALSDTDTFGTGGQLAGSDPGAARGPPSQWGRPVLPTCQCQTHRCHPSGLSFKLKHAATPRPPAGRRAPGGRPEEGRLPVATTRCTWSSRGFGEARRGSGAVKKLAAERRLRRATAVEVLRGLECQWQPKCSKGGANLRQPPEGRITRALRTF
jgi:hypothetical protein